MGKLRDSAALVLSGTGTHRNGFLAVICGAVASLAAARAGASEPEQLREPASDDRVPAREPPVTAPDELISMSTNLIAPFFGVYPFEANVRLSGRCVLVVNGSRFSLDSGDWRARATAVGAGFSYHLGGTALREWYLEGIAELVFASWHPSRGTRDSSRTVLGSSLSALAGYRLIWDRGLVLDLGLGLARVHIPSGTARIDGQVVASAGVTRYYPAPKINVGWAF